MKRAFRHIENEKRASLHTSESECFILAKTMLRIAAYIKRKTEFLPQITAVGIARSILLCYSNKKTEDE